MFENVAHWHAKRSRKGRPQITRKSIKVSKNLLNVFVCLEGTRNRHLSVIFAQQNLSNSEFPFLEYPTVIVYWKQFAKKTPKFKVHKLSVVYERKAGLVV